MTSHPDEYLAHLADGHALSPHDPSGHKLEDVLHDLLGFLPCKPVFLRDVFNQGSQVSFSGTFFTAGVFATATSYTRRIVQPTAVIVAFALFAMHDKPTEY